MRSRLLSFKTFIAACFTILSVAVSPLVFAQQKENTIHLRSGVVTIPDNFEDWQNRQKNITGKQSPQQVLLTFPRPLSVAEQEAMKASGIMLLDAMSGNVYTAIIDSRAAGATLPLTPQGLLAVDPKWKIDAATQQASSANSTAQVAVLVSIAPSLKDEALSRFQAVGATVLRDNLAPFGYYEISLPTASVLQLASWYGVRSIGRKSMPVELNYESKNATEVNIAQLPVSAGGYGLRGEGMTIGVGDNTHGLWHVDLRDRIINYNPAPYTAHGLHINGIVGGAGTMNQKAEGFAPSATLIDHLFDNVWINTPAMRATYGMTVTNNSYAAIINDCGYAGLYDGYSQALDQMTLAYDDVLHVFASGNDGNNTCGAYPTHFGTVVGSYQASKNGLVVANIDKMYAWGNGSSRGPVKDGRIKPEISAIGTDVLSTTVNDTYFPFGGTSMASPQVAGAALLLAQHYKQLFGGANPKADILKALLMNGATDLGNPGPDYTFGFGHLNLLHALRAMDSSWYGVNTLANGAQQTINISVPAGTAALKVMLYWQDQPGSPLVSMQLVNDLDLQVTTPAAVTHLPLVLDTNAANVDNNAVEDTDRLNNVEQVVINTPAAGAYTATITGHSIPTGPQRYVLVYDLIKDTIALTYPTKTATAVTGDVMRIYWDASDGANPFTLEFSSNNGAAWTTLSNSIPAAQRYYNWTVPSTNSELCKMRLSRNSTSQVYTTGTFVLNDSCKLTASPTAMQCPGTMRVQWTAVPNATGYLVFRKIGPYLTQIASVSSATLFYSQTGLSLDSNYYMAVQPLINGVPGQRSLGVRRRPNTGTCTQTQNDFDLMLDKVLSPVSGRIGTSTARSASDSLKVQLRNLDNITNANYKVSYSINGGAWAATTFNTAATNMTATGTRTVKITGLNLAAAGTYTIRVAVQNLAGTDPQTGNDSATVVVRQLNNNAVSLATPATEDFESTAALNQVRDTFGFDPAERWDFTSSNDTGRMRTYVNDDITISGNRSISLDNIFYFTPSVNILLGTYNLSSYSVASSEVRLEFDYRLHGIPAVTDSNKLYIHGTDAAALKPVYTYDFNTLPGTIINSGSLSLTDVLSSAGQNFSSSTQLVFGQRDSSCIATSYFGAGVTIDNIKMYLVQNDVEAHRLVSPATGCGLGASTPVSVMVYNRVSAAQTNIPITYKLDGGTPVTETITASIPAKDSLLYTFTTPANIAAPGLHTISVWVAQPGDSYAANDSLLNSTFHNQPLVSTFPYLERFEAGDGNYYTEGANDSWAYGTPASLNIDKAASGTKAWKTNLAGDYNNFEKSYLYSPCFDISGLATPMLSFSLALDIENCGASLCDEAHVEWSNNNGQTWTKLGAAGQGTNWYNDASFQVWTQQDFTRWHVASIPLPASATPVRLRFAFKSDPGTVREGIAIDDIHVFNRTYPIYDSAATGPITTTVSGNSFINFTQGGKVLAQINPQNENLGSTSVQLYQHNPFYTPEQTQYYLPRSFTVKSANTPADSVLARFYVLESEVDSLITATNCPSCTQPADVYELGISKYDDPYPAHINGTLNDNVGGSYQYYPATAVKWVPYDKGYYAEVLLPSFSEIWFNNGGLNGGTPLPLNLLDFQANKINEAEVRLIWLSNIDTDVARYELQSSQDGLSFTAIYNVDARHENEASYSFTDAPQIPLGGVVYYRLKWTNLDRSVRYSPVRRVEWTGQNQVANVFPNPSRDGQLTVSWSAQPGTSIAVSVRDMVGREVARYSDVAQNWNNETRLQLPAAATGIYLLHITVGDASFVKRVVVGRE